MAAIPAPQRAITYLPATVVSLISPSVPRLISIDEILSVRSQQPVATTRGRGWNGVTLDLHRPYFNVTERFAGLDHHVVGYCPSGRARLVQKRAGIVHESVIKAGMSLVLPAGYESTWEGDSGLSARLRIPRSLIAAAADHIGCRDSRVEIRNVFAAEDPVIQRLAQTLLREMDTGAHPAQALIVESVSTALAAHLLRSYNTFGAVECEPKQPLGKLELVRLTAYIEDNLERSIGLEELAAVVKVSRFHFSRLFKRSTGTTAITYVEQRRISRAKTLITETDLPLSEIALLTGFADQSHFTRRFHRYAGCTPGVFAREQGRRRRPRPMLQNDIVPVTRLSNNA